MTERSVASCRPLTLKGLLAAEAYPVEEEVLDGVEGARVLHLDRPAIEADFPALADADDRALCDWLIGCGAWMTRANSALNAVNTPPRLSGASTVAYRPPRYGRATLIPTVGGREGSEAVLVDVKGVGRFGDATPSLARHASGIAVLPDTMRELLNRAVLDRLFRREGSHLSCLPIYGVLDLGVAGRNRCFAAEVPAVALVRRAEIRWADNNEIPATGSANEEVLIGIELFLRRFGITSSAPEGGLDFKLEGGKLTLALGEERFDDIPERFLWELVRRTSIDVPCHVQVNNVQITRDFSLDPLSARITDLEQYRNLSRELTAGLLTFVADRPFNWGRLIRPTDSDWVEPDPARVVDDRLYGLGAFSRLTCDVLQLDAEARAARDIEGSVRVAYDLAARVIVGALDRDGLAEEIDAFAAAVVPHGPA